MADFSPNDTTNESQGKAEFAPCFYCHSTKIEISYATICFTGQTRCQAHCRSCGVSGPNFIARSMGDAHDGAKSIWAMLVENNL